MSHSSEADINAQNAAKDAIDAEVCDKPDAITAEPDNGPLSAPTVITGKEKP